MAEFACKHDGCAHIAVSSRGHRGVIRQAAQRHRHSYHIHCKHVLDGGCRYCRRLVKIGVWRPLRKIQAELLNFEARAPWRFRGLSTLEDQNVCAD